MPVDSISDKPIYRVHRQKTKAKMPPKIVVPDTTSATASNSLLAAPTQAVSHQTATSRDSYRSSVADEPPAGTAPKASSSMGLGILKQFLKTTTSKGKQPANTSQADHAGSSRDTQTTSLAPSRQINHNLLASPSRSAYSSTSDFSTSSRLRSVPMERTSNALVGASHISNSNHEAVVAIPHRRSQGDGVVTTTYEYITQKEMLRRYPIVCYSDKSRPDNAISKRLRRYLQPQAKEFASVLRQTYNSNILLLPEDPDLRRPAILALQKELGHRIPVIDFKKLYYGDRDPKRPFLPGLVTNFYDALRKQAGVTPDQPLVLFLKNTSTQTLLLLASEENSKSIFKDRNLRLIVETTPEALKPYYPHLGEEDEDMKLKLRRFKEVTLHTLPPSDWSSLLKNAHETAYLQKKYRCLLTELQLRQLLQVVLRKNKGKLAQTDVLSSLDSLGAFMRLNYPKESRAYVRAITDNDLKGFFEKEGLSSTGASPLKFSFELEHGLEDLIGLEEPKSVLKMFANHFKYADLSSATQKNKAQVKTMLIHGPPGLGKTMFAEGAAKELEKLTDLPVTFVSTNGGNFSTGKKFKDGIEAVDIFFNHIENADTPVVVAFVDEIDGMYNRKGSDSANAAVATDMQATSNHFLTRAQKLKSTSLKKVLFISATNHAAKLDEALTDRVDYEFSLSHSDAAHKKKLLELQFKNYSLQYDDALLKRIIQKIETGKYNISERKLSSFVEQLYDLAFDTLSSKTEKTIKMKLGIFSPPKLKVTDAMINKVLERFQSAQSNNQSSDEEAWWNHQGII